MAVSSRTMTRHRDYSRVFIALGLLAGVVAIAPIVAAAIGLGAPATGPRTAFASAPAGDYAVISRSEGAVDVIAVAWADNPGAVTEIARVPRIEGFPSAGAVSPDGTFVALIIVDDGSPANPAASLAVVSLESGAIVRAATNAVPGQAPVWSSDGATLAFARETSQGDFVLVQVGRGGKGEAELQEFHAVLGIYPVGYDAEAHLTTVVIDGNGSHLHRVGAQSVALSPNLTRDWELSPDGTALAFIDVETAGGVKYVAREASLVAAAAGASAQALTVGVSALGSAWNPATGRAAFGVEPGGTAGVSVQALSSDAAGGFDVPLSFSTSGQALAVTHWSGSSFEKAGAPELQLITASGRASYENFTRFLGWSER